MADVKVATSQRTLTLLWIAWIGLTVLSLSIVFAECANITFSASCGKQLFC